MYDLFAEFISPPAGMEKYVVILCCGVLLLFAWNFFRNVFKIFF